MAGFAGLSDEDPEPGEQQARSGRSAGLTTDYARSAETDITVVAES